MHPNQVSSSTSYPSRSTEFLNEVSLFKAAIHNVKISPNRASTCALPIYLTSKRNDFRCRRFDRKLRSFWKIS